MAEEEMLEDRRDYSVALAKINQRLEDRAPVIAAIGRRSDDNAASLSRLETKVAAIEAVLHNGLAAMVKEMHRALAEHVAREELMVQIAKEERSHLAEVFRSMTKLMISVGGFVFTAALGVIGYLFHLNFGVH